MVQLSYVYATTQVNCRTYLAISQIRSHSLDSHTDFDQIQEKGFVVVCNPGMAFSLLQEQI